MDNIATGIVLHFTATDKTISYEDVKAKEVMTAHHAVFDELHF